MLSALLGIILVRLLSKDDYGVYAYAFSIVSIFMLFNGLGAVSAILQLGSEKHDDDTLSDSYYFYGYKAGLISDAALTMCMLGFALFLPFSIPGSNQLLLAYLPYPALVLLCEIKLTKLRVELKNKQYAFMTNLQTFSLVAFSIIGAVLGGSVGLIVGQSLAYGVTYGVLCLKCPSERKKDGIRKLSTGQVKDYWVIAINSSLNSGLSQALTLTGSFLIGALLMNEAMVAEYKVATTIPFALLFIPNMVVVYVYPYFARNQKDRAWSLSQYKKLITILFIAIGLLCLPILFFAHPIIALVFGDQYVDAVPAFGVLMIGFFVTAVFRQPTGNLLVTQRRLSFNFAIGVVSIVVNVLLSIALIPNWGLVGAAWAYTGTMIVGSVLNVPYYCAIAGKAKKA